MNSKQDLLMLSLTQFFKVKSNLTKMLRVVHGESNISLRILDWFITNYSKKYNTSYDIVEQDGSLKKIIIFLNYKSQLKAYSKKQFDPFCRRERISFYDYDNNEIVTTVGQLNFFRWAIENKIIEYVDKNIASIEEDMNNSLHSLHNSAFNEDESSNPNIKCGKNITKLRKKRQELSVSAIKTVNKENVKIIVKFE